MDETDAELVLRIRRGDRQAAGRLLERYLRVCRAVALAVTGTEPDAEDVCQDAFVIAIEKIDECREPSRFCPWLLQIVRNTARNHVRRQSTRRTVSLDDRASGGLSPADAMEQDDLRRRLLAALATLTEQQREIVLLHDLEGWKHREIAERLGLPAGTVRSHLHHARRRLRGILGTGSDG